MGSLTERLLADTRRELAAIDRKPVRKRLPRFLLLALEREQIAAVAYSDDLVAERIRALAIDEPMRELVRRVVMWTHTDEALHAQYIRGLLLQSRQAMPAAFIVARQIVGGVSGWVTAVSSNAESWGLRSTVARAAIKAGSIAGRVPDGLEHELTYRGFRHYCEVNMALEETAILSYERILGMLTNDEQRDAFTRILDDERRHSAVFRTMADAFTDDDTLRPGVTVESVTKRIEAISPWFLPAEHRRDVRRSAFGRGSVVRAERGGHDELDATLARAISPELERLVRANPGPVAVRAHFMLGYNRNDMSTLVHPDTMAALARMLRSWGATDVALVETPMAYDRFFANRSVREVADYFGFTSPDYRIVDVAEDAVPIHFERGLVSSKISATWADASVRIVLSKLRGDPAEVAHLSMASLGGIGQRTDDHLYTDRMVDHRTAALMAVDVAPPDFAIVDAWAPVADGPLGVMGCSKPCMVRRFYAGADALSVDRAVLADIGCSNPFASEFMRQADHWFGSFSGPPIVEGEPGPIEGFRAPQSNLWFRFINATAAPIYLNLSNHGSLFVPDMDTEAFPPIDRPSLLVRSVRRGAQSLFGLHPPKQR